MTYDFNERLAFSKGKRIGSDRETIMSLLDGCVEVVPACEEDDKAGVDYIATLLRGGIVLVDAKTRTKGCSRYWKNGQPELAIEIWSVMPGGKYNQCNPKIGWTLDDAKKTHAVLYTFDPSDCEVAFLFPFQHLRMAARRTVTAWMNRFKVDVQDSGTWESQAVFVPAVEIISALEYTYSGCVGQD